VTPTRLWSIAPFLWHVAKHRAPRRWPTLSVGSRLQMLPDRGLPLREAVVIHWDEHQVPFIEAREDEDLAATLGLVHAHLRLGQLEMMRRVSQGRVAEAIGRAGIEIDRAMRTLDLGRAVPEILPTMPADTRRWLEAVLRGLNHYISHARALPHEFEIFGLGREPWTAADILILGRFVSADVNWLVWFQLLKYRTEIDWPRLWHRICEHDVLSCGTTGKSASAVSATLPSLLGCGLRSGSNSFAVSSSRSATGAPLIGGDPHLPVGLPSPWLICGIASPSYRAVGLMIPGLPFVALGRNSWIAWGGTNLHAASSDLVAVPTVAMASLRERREKLDIRWRRPRTICIRESAWGPVVTDLPWLRGSGEVLALRWMGHRPSDEITAMLRVNRARNWTEFQDALDGFAVPGQRMLYADAGGHIGELMAVHLPHRQAGVPRDLRVTPEAEAGWAPPVTSKRLAWRIDPAEGFIASANERPKDSGPLVGFHFSPPDRKRRLDDLLSLKRALSLEDFVRIQRDVHSTAALGERDQLLSWLRTISREMPRNLRERQVIDDLAAWDGDYAADSRGALVFELLLYHLGRRIVRRRQREAYAASWGTRALIWDDILSAAANDRKRALRRAVRDAARESGGRSTWGARHRLRLTHPLGLAPLVGRPYRFTDLPAAGSSETLCKTAHPLTDKKHAVRYGSGARYISDLSDPDRNFLVLLGGQDGWFGSTTFGDQIDLWQRNKYLEVPLRSETVRAAFPYRTELAP